MKSATAAATREAFKAALAGDDLVVAPGVYDGISVHAVERAGCHAAYMTGAGTAATYGYPDYGLITMSEMVANAARLVAATDLPVIADADTGYGNELNVVRTVQEYERAGVAAIHLEDQGFPKKCGHLEDKEIIPLDAFVKKIRAAVDTRVDPNFVIIARTDSRAPIGFDEAVQRSNAALEAGADIAFLEAPQTMEEFKQVPKLVKGPCLINMVWRGKSPEVKLAEAQAMGFKLAILPGLLIKAAVGAFDEALAAMHQAGAHPKPRHDMSLREMFDKVGGTAWDGVRKRYGA
ncbi:MAG: isocitrate lyase/PEP mutase family protein [Pseudomonadota bacterium]